MFPKAKILRLNALHRLQEPQSNWFQNNLMTTKLAIKFAVFCRDLTLVAKYALLQAPSHLEIWLQAPGGILQPGWKGEKWKRLCESQTLVCWHPLQYYVRSKILLTTSNVPQLRY